MDGVSIEAVRTTTMFIPPKDIGLTRDTLKDGAEVVRHPWSANLPDPKMNVNFQPSFSIGFGHSSPPVEGRRVIDVLGEIGEHITSKVLPPLTRYLTSRW